MCVSRWSQTDPTSQLPLADPDGKPEQSRPRIVYLVREAGYVLTSTNSALCTAGVTTRQCGTDAVAR